MESARGVLAMHLNMMTRPVDCRAKHSPRDTKWLIDQSIGRKAALTPRTSSVNTIRPSIHKVHFDEPFNSLFIMWCPCLDPQTVQTYKLICDRKYFLRLVNDTCVYTYFDMSYLNVFSPLETSSSDHKLEASNISCDQRRLSFDFQVSVLSFVVPSFFSASEEKL